MTEPEKELVRRIRIACGRELGKRPEYPFFAMSYAPGLSDDDALLRIFRDESEAMTVTLAPGIQRAPSFERIIQVLCHG